MTRERLPSLEESKGLTLKALLYFLHESNDTEWLELSDVQDICSDRLSLAFTRRVLAALEEEGYVETANDDPGVTLYSITIEGIEEAELRIKEDGVTTPIGAAVPASDRVVRLDHNSSGIVEAKNEVAALRDQLRSTNDVGNLSVDDIDAAVNELNTLSTVLEAEAVRPVYVLQVARKSLRWIAEKSAGAAVGKAALALLASLAALFGITF